MANTTVKLTAYNMGDEATEEDFDKWVSFVGERIAAKCGFTVDVEAFNFESGPAEDLVTLGEAAWEVRDEKTATVREALEALWADWCSEGAPAAATA